MVRYVEDKKRVIVLDKDIEGLDDKEWKGIMRRVLGRHYQNLKKMGPGWTFPHHSLSSFEEMVAALADSSNVVDVKQEEEPDMIMKTTTTTTSTSTMTDNKVRDKCTQTIAIKVVATPSFYSESQPYRYKYDVDESMREFCRKWLE